MISRIPSVAIRAVSNQVAARVVAEWYTVEGRHLVRRVEGITAHRLWQTSLREAACLFDQCNGAEISRRAVTLLLKKYFHS